MKEYLSLIRCLRLFNWNFQVLSGISCFTNPIFGRKQQLNFALLSNEQPFQQLKQSASAQQ